MPCPHMPPRLSKAALALVLSLGLGAGRALAADAGREAELKRLVRQDCGSCHGLSLKGGLGKPLLPGALAHLDAQGVAAVIMDGVPGTPMPPWRGILSEEDALWIATKLKEGFPE